MEIFNYVAGILAITFMLILVNWVHFMVFVHKIEKSKNFKENPFKFKKLSIFRIKFMGYVNIFYIIINFIYVVSYFIVIVLSILVLCDIIDLLYFSIAGGIHICSWIMLCICFASMFRKDKLG
jgi:hypothetical protein